MENKYKIVNCDENYLIQHAEDFSSLCVASFGEHLNNNVMMGPCFMTPEIWVVWAKGCIGQCIMDKSKMIAFWLAKPNYQTKEVNGRILAVDPQYKGQHLGTTLSRSRSHYLQKIGMNIFYTDTSLKAPHVIKFHKSYGCKVIGLASWSNTNYYSVLFRLALRPEYEITERKAKHMFLWSNFKCRLLYNENGSKTLIGKIYFISRNFLKRIFNININHTIK